MKMDEFVAINLRKCEANKKVSRLPAGFEDHLKLYARLIYAANALPRNAKQIMGVPISEYPVIDALADFVFPNSVTITGNERQRDLLVRTDIIVSEPISVDDIHDFVSEFYGIFKKQATEKRLSDCKAIDYKLSTEDALSACSWNDLMVTEEPSKLPIPINMQIFRDSAYMYEESAVIKLMLDKIYKAL